MVQMLLVILGLAVLFSRETLTEGLNFATGQSWHDLAFALPLAMLAYTGLETVANLAEETREPGATLPRSLFSAIGLVVVVTVLISVVGVTAFPSEDGLHRTRDHWVKAPIVGIVDRLRRRAARHDRGHASGRRRRLRRAHPLCGGDNRYLGVHPARPFAG